MDKLNFNDFKRTFTYKDKYKKVGFVAFPKAMFFDERLSVYHLKVAGILEIHAFSGKKQCFPSLATIAIEAAISKPTVIKCLNELQSLGYIEIEKKHRKVNHYYLKFW